MSFDSLGIFCSNTFATRKINFSYTQLGAILPSNCRFIITHINEAEIRSADGYSIFEPTLKLEVQGQNVFREMGVDGIDRVVIMHFIETALRKTRKLVEEFPGNAKRDYPYGLLGTGVIIRLKRNNGALDVFLETESRFGPVPKTVAMNYSNIVGTISLRDWVEAIVDLSGELIDYFRLLNPRVYEDLKNLELHRQILGQFLQSL